MCCLEEQLGKNCDKIRRNESEDQRTEDVINF